VARPKSFDPDTVLAKAMGVFWEKGFDAASISDLTAAMGINRFSLYDTFGDKHALYIKALDAYSENVVGSMVERINSLGSLDDVQAMFFGLIEFQHSGACSPCCMMHKAAVSLASVDEQARERVEQARVRFHGAFHTALERIKRSGGLRDGLDLNDAAWLLMISKSGLMSYHGSPVPEDQAKGAVRSMIDQFRA
jgi:TetR/AcrR family transcriptional regulator, transcriptional repressor for nem operon